MPTEPSAAAAVALLFPGQGAQRAGMLEPFRAAPGFARSCAAVSDLIGRDVLALDDGALAANLPGSLATVLAGVLALRSRPAPEPPLAVAGYSVGQWTALHAAGVLAEEALFTLVAQRARLMDEALAAAPPSGMLAVIGVTRTDLDAVCAAAAAGGLLLHVANDNAPAQATLGGTLPALEFAQRELAPRRPRVLKRLPVAGAWHGPLMAPVVPPLRALLSTVDFSPARFPVVDNTRDDWLPLDDRAALVEQLALHVARPVLWQQGVRRLVAAGASRLLECGWGDVLTRFGLFIDRAVTHEALVPLPRERG